MRYLLILISLLLVLPSCHTRKKAMRRAAAAKTAHTRKPSGKTQNSGTHKYTTDEYIAIYKNTAVKQMRSYGIPASITLAQGILESGNGNSDLARNANNHFGIKCTSDWKGRSYHKDDDERNACFRSYPHAEASFKDHALFLKRSRYEFLYSYRTTDYEKWAKGLKKAGYATNPKYPELLIGIIEKYALHKFDR